MQPRKNELTAVSSRDMFDRVPGGVTDPADIARWHSFREKYHNAARLGPATDFPLQIDFELNSTCQMKCGFCVHGHEKVKKQILPFETFCRVIDEGARFGLCSIKLNYINEPLLLPSLIMYINYARSRGVLNVYFATNGLLLTEKVSRNLIDAKVSKVMVSLDATTPETFKQMRGSDKLDVIVNNITRLIEMRGDKDYPLVRVNFLKTKVNEHEAVAFLDQWTGVADMVGFQEQLNRPGTLDVQCDYTFKCAFPFKLVTVDSSGAILPCFTFSGREIPLGHIDDMTIHKAWNSFNMWELRSLHREGLGKTIPACNHCIGAN